MRAGPAAPLLALAALLALAGAAAADGPGPRLAGDPPADRALASVADAVDETGCVRSYDACRPGATKWAAVAAAHAGEDPRTWPAPDRSVGSWILDHADDLRDHPTRRCQEDASQGAVCMARRVYSLSKSTLAAEAIGGDARALPLPGGGTRDLVAELNENVTAGQYGSPSHVNDDVWALVALHAAGWDGPQARDAADFVASNQNGDGGLGYTPSASSSADTTAAALAAMAPRDRTGFVDDALGFLADAQVTGGPGQGCFALDPGREANAASTAWALQGLVAAGENPLDWAVDGATPTDCLLRFQADDGGFANSLDDAQDRPTLGATMDAVTGLAWTPFGDARGPVTPEARDRTVRAGEPVTLQAPDGFLAHGSDVSTDVTLTPTDAGERTLDGWTWTPEPHPLRVRLRVLPALPAAPGIHAPDPAPSHEPVAVNLTPGDRWTETLHLTLPDGTTLEGPQHDLDLPPGLHRLQATGRNALGEAGDDATHVLRVRNAPPEVAVDGPSHAEPGADVTLRARASDPGGGPVTQRWEAPDGTGLGAGPNLTLPAAEPGHRREVVAVATDDRGASTRAPHLVRWTGAPPNLTIRGPTEAPRGNVTLSAEAHHPREPVNVTWYQGGRAVGHGPTLALAVEPGNHTLRAVARTPNATAEATHEVVVPVPGGPGADAPLDPGRDAPAGEETDPPAPGSPGSGPGNPPTAADVPAQETPGAGLADLLAGLLAATALAALPRRGHRNG